MRRNGMGLLVFGTAFTVLGGAALLEVFTETRVLHDLWRLWPMLLVVMGVKIVYDYFASGARRV